MIMTRLLSHAIAVLLLCVSIVAMSAYCDDLAQITKVVSKVSGAYEDVVISTSRAVEPKLVTLSSPNRLALVFPNTTLCSAISLEGKTPLIKSIQAVQLDWNTAYVIVEPGEKLNYVYAGYSGSNMFILEFSKAAYWSIKTIAPSSEEPQAGTPVRPSKAVRESMECVIFPTRVVMVTSEVKKISAATSGKSAKTFKKGRENKVAMVIRGGRFMKAKNFELPDQDGKIHRLVDYRGRWLVLYFYPKDFTSGCTTQACSYRDFIAEIRAKGAEVVGVSMDTVESHKKFHDQYHLNFDILSDPDGVVVKDYGIYSLIGNAAVAKRTTFLIDPSGDIVKTYENVDPTKDARNILADLGSEIPK